MALSLFPVSTPYAHGTLPPEDGHKIYFEECGTQSGIPLLYLHGGPGSGFSTDITQLLDPDHYRIILMDQRGSGHSTPHGSLTHNTTPHLVDDIERLRHHLGIETWHVFGGSWGATLAIAYAMAHPSATSALTLYGVFLARQHELEALYFDGGVAASMFPDVFAAFMDPLMPDQQTNPIIGYGKLFQSADETVRRDALNRWTTLEKAVSRLILDETQLSADLSDPDFVLAHSLIENHYFCHHGFIDADDILQRAGQTLADIPINIVAARYDIVCPPQTAFDFARAVPHASLTLVEDAGHTWRDPSNTQALLQVLNAQKDTS